METSGASRRNVLLVEDDPANWLTLSAVLEEAGYTVAVAESCAEAVGLLGDEPIYDAVLLDSALGDGSGWELIPLIRRQLPEAKLVIVSGQKFPGTQALVEGVFHKGEHVGELLACLERLLHRERA